MTDPVPPPLATVSVAARLVLGLVGLYQRFLSPLMGHQCRFSPSCSHYATQAVHTYGTLKGGALALRRLARCHPWGRGGIDPVP